MTPRAAPATPGPAELQRLASPPPDTYLAESQDVHGTIVRAPHCTDGCPLSADGTIVLYDMTWHKWTAAKAVGTGAEWVLDCVPDCAYGPQYKFAVTVTLTSPEKDCATSAAMYLWTKATFRWPDGLPGGLQGPDAPYNPWTFTALQAQLGCLPAPAG
jgi:hypothetical protein